MKNIVFEKDLAQAMDDSRFCVTPEEEKSKILDQLHEFFCGGTD